VSQRLRVAIDARLRVGASGGVETVAIGIAQGFAELEPDDLDLTFVGYEDADDWLGPHLGAASLVRVPSKSLTRGGLRRATDAMATLSAGLLGGPRHVPPGVALRRDHEMNRLEADVIHYPYQAACLPDRPFLYQPHDLLHVHHPELLPSDQVRRREMQYAAMCERAALVVVGTRWVRDDVCAHFHLPRERVSVITMAPPQRVAGDAELPAALPPRYLLYPAANWPHKNHAKLIAALAVCWHGGVDVELVLTGPRLAAFPDPIGIAESLGVEEHVHDLGFLDEATLARVYEHARGVVVPTQFESASFPIWEAFQAGVPVACSDVTALPEQVGKAAILFDPDDVPAISAAMSVLWTDESVRTSLVNSGRERVGDFTWVRTAAGLAAAYRSVASGAAPDDGAMVAAEVL
jgi:glycosyltransferase involved in cell wall biosynthesis